MSHFTPISYVTYLVHLPLSADLVSIESRSTSCIYPKFSASFDSFLSVFLNQSFIFIPRFVRIISLIATIMWSKPREEDAAPSPWPLIRDDGRTLRVVDTSASVEAMRIRSKKQYEKDRSDSNGIGIIPRCPLKGTGLHKIGARGRHMILDRDFPMLFTV